MKYPDETTSSKPVVGQEAKALLKAVESGNAITSEQAEDTIARILKYERQGPNRERKRQIRRRDV